MQTMFAPPERLGTDIINQQKIKFSNQELLSHVINAVPDIVLILNHERQIVFTNDTLIKLLNNGCENDIYGMRPGEAFNCEHAFDTEGGCGTTEFCRTCGAINAILVSQSGEATVKECRIIQKDTSEALDLRVWATPLDLEGEKYTIFSVKDISDEKRRKALERIFFHDILNTAGVIKGIVQILNNYPNNDDLVLKTDLEKITLNLIEEIKNYRELTNAETNELNVEPSAFKASDFIIELADLYQSHEVAKGKGIILRIGSSDIKIFTDKILLKRILGNMIKNAFEATEIGQKIVLGFDLIKDDRISFFVQNNKFIPRSIQLQIFQRSFSTKGSDRGLGTYSMKVLCERYLKGKISFKSTKHEGTTFYAELPIIFEE